MSRSETIAKWHAKRQAERASKWIHENGIVKIPIIGTELFAIIDEDDFAVISQYAWFPSYGRSSKTVYAIANSRGEKPRRRLMLHRILLNARENEQVDHIDRDGLNCRRSNLRIASQIQNLANTSRKDTKMYRGVSLKQGRYWIAQIQYNGKKLHLGTFETPELAALAYNESAIAFYGEFASLNEL